MEAAGVPVLPGATVTDETDLELRVAGETIGFPLLVKAAFGGGGRGMRVVHEPATLPRPSRAPAGRPRRRSATARCSWSGSSSTRATSRCRSSATRTARSCTCSSASARSSGATRRSSRRPVAGRRRRAARRARRRRRRRGQGHRLHRRRHRRVRAGPGRAVLLPRGQHPAAGRAPGHRAGHRARPGGAAAAGRRGRRRCRRRSPAPRSTGTRSRSGSTPRTCAAGFLPATGTLHRFAVPDLPGVRVDAGVDDGSVVGTHYDPMLAKVIAHGRTRDRGRPHARPSAAPRRLHGVTTNRDLLVGILREPEFLAGRTDTGYLTRHDPLALGRPRADARGRRRARRWPRRSPRRPRTGRRRGCSRGLPSGWRNVPAASRQAVVHAAASTLEVALPLPPSRARGARSTASRSTASAWSSATPTRGRPGGRRRAPAVHRAPRRRRSLRRQALGAPRSPRCRASPTRTAVAHAGSLLAPMPGTVVRVLVEAGDTVTAGATSSCSRR